MSTDANPDFAEYVAHADFRDGLPRGRFRVIVNPKLARAYVRQRLLLLPIVIAVMGAGLALAASGAMVPGAVLVFGGIAMSRLVTWNAGKILLQLAMRDPAVYAFVTENAIMEVRRA